MRPTALLASGLAFVLASAASGQTAAPPEPTRLWAAQTAVDQITLVWTGAPGATGYRLYRDAGGGASADAGGQPRVAVLAPNSRRYVFIVRGNKREVQQFHLEATGATGSSRRVPFNPVTLAGRAVPPVAPASVTATETSPSVITVSWTPAPGATGYLLGRAMGPSGFQRFCDFCSTETSFVDSTATPGLRHIYSVAAITPSGASRRAISNPLTPGVVSLTPDPVPGPPADTVPRTPADTVPRTPADTVPRTPADTIRPPADTAPTTPSPAPLKGRYRVTLTRFTVQAQSYDHMLQIDGKGDEVYFATHVMSFDTTASTLVVDNRVRTSRIHGDINGFSYRVKAGTAGSTGGLRTGDFFPPSIPTAASRLSDIPMLLWEGELVQGQSAVVLVPTVWEWDDQPELFMNWLTGRHALVARLLQTDPMVTILTNGNVQPMEIGAAGLFIHTNMFGDARDRPIGLQPGQPATDAGFYAPLAVPQASLLTAYQDRVNSVVGSILPGSAFSSLAATILRNILTGFNNSLGGAKANIQLATSSTLTQVLGGIAAKLRPTITMQSRLLQVAGQSQPAIGATQLVTLLRSATRASVTQGLNLYLFEKLVVLTPQAIENALAQAKLGATAMIDVSYQDASSLQGRYVLQLRLEKLP